MTPKYRNTTRGGNKVTILCTDMPARQPVVGYVEGLGSEPMVLRWYLNGRFWESEGKESTLDLIPVLHVVD